MRVPEMSQSVGPILYAQGSDAAATHLAALLILPDDTAPPPLVPEGAAPVAAGRLAQDFGWTVWRYDFALPRRPGGVAYSLNGRDWQVQTEPEGDVRIAYTSCNGSEAEDPAQPDENRNAMWRHLAAQHAESPLFLLLHGGDQLYADAVWSCHPLLADWDHEATASRQTPLSEEAIHAVRQFYWQRYLTLFGHAEVAPLLAQVPSLMMWDDHDIFDGWGSHDETLQASPAWQAIYACAREAFHLFQLAGTLPADSASFSQVRRFGDWAVMAPDLRSERTPTSILGQQGWANLTRDAATVAECTRVLVMSSVPALGPRLSWVERIMSVIPGAQRYEDDLRDQWQSRAHRTEWQRFLGLLNGLHTPACRVTVVSGEIHLATRGEMAATAGTLHQLVASGIAHPPPPPSYPRALGALAGFGEAPLPAHPIRLHPLPGRRQRYTAERNYLILARDGGRWTAQWQTEHGGPTPWLDLN